MDVTVLDQLTAWAAGMLPRHFGWTALDAGRTLVGAGSVYLIVSVLLSRTLVESINRSKTPGDFPTVLKVTGTAFAAACFILAGIGNEAGYGTAFFTGFLMLMMLAQDAYSYIESKLLHLPQAFWHGHSGRQQLTVSNRGFCFSSPSNQT